MIIFKCVSILNPFYQPHRPPEAKPPRLSFKQKMQKCKEKVREKKKLEEAEQRAQVAQEVLKVFAPSNGNIEKTLQALEHVQKILKNDEPGGEDEGGGQ